MQGGFCYGKLLFSAVRHPRHGVIPSQSPITGHSEGSQTAVGISLLNGTGER